MPIGVRVTDLPAAAGTLDDDDEFLSLEDGSLRRATRTQAGPKASIVQVTDTANQFTATNVEGVLAEIQDNVDALVISGGGMSVASEAEALAGTDNTKAMTPLRVRAVLPTVNAASYASIQAAIDALPASGGTVLIPAGDHVLAAAIETDKPNLRLVGMGAGGQSSVVGGGTTRLLVANGEWGLIFAEQTASHVHRGPVIENVQFAPNTGATPLGGIWIDNASNARLVDVTVSDMPVGFRFGSDAPTATSGSQYHEMRGPNVMMCDVGIDVVNSNGLRIFGGFLEYYPGGAPAIPAGKIGVRVGTNADTIRMFGTILQFFDVGVDLVGAVGMGEYIGLRFEACNIGIDLSGGSSGELVTVVGASGSNSIVGSSAGCVIHLTDDSRRAFLAGIHGTGGMAAFDDDRTTKAWPQPSNWITKWTNYGVAPMLVASEAAGDIPLSVMGAAGQTEVLTVWRDSANAAMAFVAANGKVYVKGELEVDGALNHDGTTVGFNGSTPVGKAANPGTATGTDAAVINAVVTALRNLGLVT